MNLRESNIVLCPEFTSLYIDQIRELEESVQSACLVVCLGEVIMELSQVNTDFVVSAELDTFTRASIEYRKNSFYFMNSVYFGSPINAKAMKSLMVFQDQGILKIYFFAECIEKRCVVSMHIFSLNVAYAQIQEHLRHLDLSLKHPSSNIFPFAPYILAGKGTENEAVSALVKKMTRMKPVVLDYSMRNFPTTMKTEPLKHQVAGFNWMRSREQLPLESEIMHQNKHVLNGSEVERPEAFAGGILADEMGLGKTYEMISLIASDYLAENLPSLIVCPLILVEQWKRQILEHSCIPEEKICARKLQKVPNLRPGTINIINYDMMAKLPSNQKYHRLIFVPTSTLFII